MYTTFKILLMFIMVVSFIGVIGEKENEKLRRNLTIIVTMSIIALWTSIVLLK